MKRERLVLTLPAAFIDALQREAIATGQTVEQVIERLLSPLVKQNKKVV